MANDKNNCKQCGERKKTDDLIKVNMNYFCGFDHATKYGMEKQQKAREKASKKHIESCNKRANASHRADKERIKPASKHLAEAQAIFNKCVRLRDFSLSCISCGKSKHEVEVAQGWKTGGAWDAGHFMTRGSKGQLRFVWYNVHKQCKSCNAGGGKFSHKAASVDERYRVNLIEKIGMEKVEYLETNNELDTRKNDIEYLKKLKRIFRKKARILEKRISH